jgi:aminocarboxymuconate-semialdehyde decarboxylase
MMRTHRDFFQDVVGTTADVVFVGCCVTDAAEPLFPSGGATPRRQVVVGGRRVKTVDVHAHCAVPEAMALMGSTVPPEGLDLGPARLRAMDAQAIRLKRRSPSPT